MRHRVITKENTFIIILAIAAFLIPSVINNPYYIHILILIMISSIAALGVYLILHTGHLSLAQAVFVAIGAYGSTLLVAKGGLSFWLSLPLSGLIAGILGVLIGYPALRLKGAYFAILTFGLGEVVRLILINWGSVTGGTGGIPGGISGIRSIPPPNMIAINGLRIAEFTSLDNYYYLGLVLLIITASVINRIDKSDMGDILNSIEQCDALAESVGINVAKFKTLSFGISCFFTGLSGAFFAHYVKCITPEDFSFWASIDYLIYAIIGGSANVFGPILGTIVLLMITNLFSFLAQYNTILHGAIIIFVIIFLPQGLISLRPLNLIEHILAKRRNKD